MRTSFGTTTVGEEVELLTLEDGAFSCSILTYGGAIRSLTVPDRVGRPTDVVLGFEALADYETQDKFIGALIGRYANRIAEGRFALGKKSYVLMCNDGPHHLHGGGVGFDKRVWKVESLGIREAVLTLESADDEEGYPGNLLTRVTYRLECGALSIHYEACCDTDTICNLTNHSYFNLSGHQSGSILEQEVCLFAERYTPADAYSIPFGVQERVDATPMDLRELTPIGAHIDDDFVQLRQAGGFDHNWVIDGCTGLLRPAALARCAGTGIVLRVDTTLPGVQFYSGNYLDGCPAGKGGAPYAKHWGFCLETQFFPDSPHHPDFPSAVLRPGETYDHTTVFRFSTDSN